MRWNAFGVRLRAAGPARWRLPFSGKKRTDERAYNSAAITKRKKGRERGTFGRESKSAGRRSRLSTERPNAGSAPQGKVSQKVPCGSSRRRWATHRARARSKQGAKRRTKGANYRQKTTKRGPSGDGQRGRCRGSSTSRALDSESARQGRAGSRAGEVPWGRAWLFAPAAPALPWVLRLAARRHLLSP